MLGDNALSQIKIGWVFFGPPLCFLCLLARKILIAFEAHKNCARFYCGNIWMCSHSYLRSSTIGFIADQSLRFFTSNSGVKMSHLKWESCTRLFSYFVYT